MIPNFLEICKNFYNTQSVYCETNKKTILKILNFNDPTFFELADFWGVGSVTANNYLRIALTKVLEYYADLPRITMGMISHTLY